jgi:hypothetical protein
MPELTIQATNLNRRPRPAVFQRPADRTIGPAARYPSSGLIETCSRTCPRLRT